MASMAIGIVHSSTWFRIFASKRRRDSVLPHFWVLSVYGDKPCPCGAVAVGGGGGGGNDFFFDMLLA